MRISANRLDVLSCGGQKGSAIDDDCVGPSLKCVPVFLFFVQLRGLKLENDRLTEQNFALTNMLALREEQLRDNTDLLTLQRAAWNDAQKLAARRPATAGDARLPNQQDNEQRRDGLNKPHSEAAGQHHPASGSPSTAAPPAAGGGPPQSRRPLSARPTASVVAAHPVQPQGGLSGQPQRPLTARQAVETPRDLHQRPNTARASFAGGGHSVKMVPVPPLMPRQGVFSKFEEDATDNQDQLKFGAFAARGMVSGKGGTPCHCAGLFPLSPLLPFCSSLMAISSSSSGEND